MIDPDDIENGELAAQVEQLQDDDTVDFDSNQRQDEGWLKVYVECPDCEVPMARTTVESETMPTPEFAHSADESRHKAVCPDCGVMVSRLRVQRVTADVNDIEDWVKALKDFKQSIADIVSNVGRS